MELTIDMCMDMCKNQAEYKRLYDEQQKRIKREKLLLHYAKYPNKPNKPKSTSQNQQAKINKPNKPDWRVFS